jgi:cellobiose phosphorylase
VSDEKVELMTVSVHNISDRAVSVVSTGCIPIFGRSLSNKHDHEQVTSLLHRTQQIDQGILVSPTMIFNEENPREADQQYFVFGAEAGDSSLPKGSFPTIDSFLGDSGTLEWPEAVVEGREPVELLKNDLDGKEIAGAISFKSAEILPDEHKTFILMIGMADDQAHATGIYEKFNSQEKVDKAFAACKAFWQKKTGSIMVKTGDKEFDSWMRWVMLQPVLRRIFGCSFLPDHDYGKGGKGWRDLWQDLLSLILIEPDSVRHSLIDNFGGVRIDGTNATIIGSNPGEFIADRNAITRVWMDHGAWPVLTMLLYIGQTGDSDILFEKNSYFRDMQLSRTLKKDRNWTSEYGNKLRAKNKEIYQGSLLEHMIVQTITQFFNVGEHNMIRLESADWNDGLDLAFHRGESVAFTSFYAGNLYLLADLLEYLQKEKGVVSVTLLKELAVLLDSINGSPCEYDDIAEKQRILFEEYFPAVEPQVSGETFSVECKILARDLRRKADWFFKKIRSQEKVFAGHHEKLYQWFNGYYDNFGRRVEGDHHEQIRMTLTGQVFAIMNGVADDKDIEAIIESVEALLKDPEHGGHRLNTDFGLRNYPDLGRAFGFAYGTKENGAVFSHMAVMYAYALYKQGFSRQGFEALNALYRMSVNTGCSKIYPNIPEYFDSNGQGMYAYLTGSASWLVLTMLTQVFGIRGEKGDLVIDPKLVSEQFSEEGIAEVESVFAGKELVVRYRNPKKIDVGQYVIQDLRAGEEDIEFKRMVSGAVRIRRSILKEITGPLLIDVDLTEKPV